MILSNKILNKFAMLPILLFLTLGCSYSLVTYENLNNKNFQFVFSDDIPNKLQNKFSAVSSSKNENQKTKSNLIRISNFMISNYDVFSGKALRSLEVEVKSSVSISISINNKIINRKLMTMKRYSSNELNILAEDEMLDFIKNEIYDDFVNQLIFEVNLIEM